MYSSATDALNQLGWLNLKQRKHFHRRLYVYKCVNGITSHKLELPRNSDVHRYNTLCKDHLRLPPVKRNWGEQRICYHAFKDWNALESDLNNSGTICHFRNNFLNLLIYSLLLYFFNICNFYLLLTVWYYFGLGPLCRLPTGERASCLNIIIKYHYYSRERV